MNKTAPSALDDEVIDMNIFLRSARIVLATILVLLTTLSSSSSAFRGQNVNTPATTTPTQTGNGQAVPAADPWSSLSLTPDQKLRIKAIRDQVKLEQQSANQRVQSAQQALDDAIYSDNPDEAVVNERARELSEARAQALTVRSRTELNIRRVLSAEQLNIFRELRRKAAEERNAAAKAKANAARAQRQQRALENIPGNKKQPLRKENTPGPAPGVTPLNRHGAGPSG